MLDFEAPIDPAPRFAPCRTGSLDEFLLERYTAFTKRGPTKRLFRVWHSPWPQVPIEISRIEDGLIDATGPWFRRARRVGATYSPGFHEVWMGRPRRIP